ncbi:MAG: hypothetical protein ACI837_002848 [Crocinitomicaceae bacterium]|jgi:hypothetical protein
MRSFLFIAFTIVSSFTFAGDQDSLKIAEVETVIQQLFKAMQDGDSTSARIVFHVDARLMSAFESKEGPKVHDEPVVNFLHAIGTPHDETWDERISNLIIQVDGTLAQAWMDYSFYLDNGFSHCGVNAMQFVLFRQSLADNSTHRHSAS